MTYRSPLARLPVYYGLGVVTVLASAVGPVLLTGSRRVFGSFDPLFFVAGTVALGLALAAWKTELPRGERPRSN